MRVTGWPRRRGGAVAVSGRAVVAIRGSGYEGMESADLAVSVAAVTAAGRGSRGGDRRGRGPGGRGEAGGGHEEVLDALAGDLAGVIVGEGVQQVPVVGDLVAVDVHDRGELAGQPGGGR